MSSIKVIENQIVEPNLHDSELVKSVHDTKIKQLELSFINEDNNNIKLIFENVEYVSMTGVIHQNIVLDVNFYHKEDITSVVEDEVRIFLEANGMYKKFKDGVMSGKLKLVQVVPSIGASLCVVCGDVTRA